MSHQTITKTSIFKMSKVTSINDMKLHAKVLHVAFSSVFIGIFQVFGTKCGSSMGYGDFKAVLRL